MTALPDVVAVPPTLAQFAELVRLAKAQLTEYIDPLESRRITISIPDLLDEMLTALRRDP